MTTRLKSQSPFFHYYHSYSRASGEAWITDLHDGIFLWFLLSPAPVLSPIPLVIIFAFPLHLKDSQVGRASPTCDSQSCRLSCRQLSHLTPNITRQRPHLFLLLILLLLLLLRLWYNLLHVWVERLEQLERL